MFTVGCERNRLANAESIYNKEKYISAIIAYDNFLGYATNGAYRTEAEMFRSESYLELAKLAFEKENYFLAERLAILANSEKADLLLAEAYYKQAEEKFEENDIDGGWEYLKRIVNVIPTSKYVPEILFRRVQYDIDMTQSYKKALPNYKELYDNFPDSEYEIEARNLFGRFVTNIIKDSYSLRDSIDADRGLEFLFEIEKYPIGKDRAIYLTISHLYEEKADLNIRFEKYHKAREEFQLAMEYAPEESERIHEKMVSYAEDFISRGNDMINYRRYENAITLCQMAFLIIPAYEPAQLKIKEIEETIDAVKHASYLIEQGLSYENSREYSKAIPLYEEAYNLDPLPEYKERIIVAKNLKKAEDNPIEFVSNILKNYKNGIMDKKIQEKLLYLKTQYEDEDITSSDWKIMRSTGRYKFEVRYDIFTPGRDYFYVWQVNVKDKAILPLNKISEELMKE